MTDIVLNNTHVFYTKYQDISVTYLQVFISSTYRFLKPATSFFKGSVAPDSERTDFAVGILNEVAAFA